MKWFHIVLIALGVTYAYNVLDLNNRLPMI